MVIFLYGPDTFRLSRKSQEIIEACQQKTHNLNFAVLMAPAKILMIS